MSVFTKEGFVALRLLYGVALAGLAVAAFLIVGTYLYWQNEKKNDLTSQRQQNEARSRLANAKQQRDDVRDSAQTYQALTSRGVFLAEQRLDLIEAMAALKERHRLATLEYEVAPQRPLQMATGATFSGVRVLASRVKLKASALNDADLVAFLDEFPNLKRGVFPLDRCVLKRETRADGTPAAGSPGAPAGASRPESATKEVPMLQAECNIEWITMKDVPATPAATGARRT